jgi:hypothetical protein
VHHKLLWGWGARKSLFLSAEKGSKLLSSQTFEFLEHYFPINKSVSDEQRR